MQKDLRSETVGAHLFIEINHTGLNETQTLTSTSTEPTPTLDIASGLTMASQRNILNIASLPDNGLMATYLSDVKQSKQTCGQQLSNGLIERNVEIEQANKWTATERRSETLPTRHVDRPKLMHV